MPGQPESISTEILGTINRHWMAGAPLDRFTLRALRDQAKSVLKADPTAGYTLLGAIDALAADPNAMRSHHETALRISPHDFQALCNYAISLHKLGYFSEALEKARRAASWHPTPDAYFHLAKCAAGAGRIREAAQALEAANKFRIALQQSGWEALVAYRVLKAMPLVEHLNLSDDELEGIQHTVVDVLHQAKIYRCSIQFDALPDEDEDLLSLLCFINEDAVRIQRLNEILVHRLASRDEVVADGSSFVAVFMKENISDGSDTRPATAACV